MVPRAVLMNSGLVSVNTARQVNTAHSKTTVNAARPMSYLYETSHSTVKRPINNNTAIKNSNINQRVNTGNPQMDLQDKGVIDSGCSRHMTGNRFLLTDLRSDRWRLLLDESQVFLRVPRKYYMYSVDLKNIVPKEDNLYGGLPSKRFENDETCVACQKGKKYKASCKTKTENSISLPLHLLYMDLFGLTFVKSLMKKMYCLVVIDNYSRFTWVFFLATKDETSGILKSFITRIENLVDHKVKVKVISVDGTPQQNRVAKRKNRTLIEAAKTMLPDSKLPTTFWAEAVNTALYVQNKVLVVKPHNKTPYELFHGRTPTLSFMRPFGCPVTILNTIDHLGKFDGKADEGSGPDWLFDIDALTRTINYEPIVAGTQSNGFTGTKASDNAGQARKETEPVKDYILLPLWTTDLPFSQDPKSSHDDGSKPSSDDGKKVDEDPRKDSESNDQEKEDNVNSTNNVNAASTNEVNVVGGKTSIELLVDPNMPALEDYSIFDFTRDDEDDGVETDMNKYGYNNPLQVKQKNDGIFISQDKYVAEILKKFGFTEVKTASTPMETQKPLLKDEDGEKVDVLFYRSMIGSLMYLTSSRPDIMFAMCACARYQVNPKVSHLHAVKKIFRYLKGQSKLGLWYPKDSPFDLVAYTNSDYAGASLDRKSTTGGFEFLGCRLISW
ncbi:putative ribonuclease H-like domain-containing protein [Tanacetum coccineum]